MCFNWLGYRFVFDYLEKKQDKLLEAQIDSDKYNDNELISIKTPFSLPYFTNSNKFERWSGEIEIDGVVYKYVKRRFYNDSMEVLCLPNLTATKLKSARHDFFRAANDLPSSNNPGKKPSPETNVFKNILSEFCQEISEYDFTLPDELTRHYSSVFIYIPEVISDYKGQPPQTA